MYVLQDGTKNQTKRGLSWENTVCPYRKSGQERWPYVAPGVSKSSRSEPKRVVSRESTPCPIVSHRNA